MYVLIDILGKQYQAEVGSSLKVDYMEDKKENDKIEFDKVMLLKDGSAVEIGTPYLSKKVTASVVRHDKGDKVTVFKYKSGKDYRRKKGHKQNYTILKVEKIG